MTASSSTAGSGASEPGPAVATYRLSVGHLVRILAPVAMLVGAAWVVWALTGALDTVGMVLAAITVLVVLLAAALILRPPHVLRLSDDGYAVSLVRGTGPRGAAWKSVDAVVTREVQGVACLVVTLEGGDTTVLPLSLLGRRSVEAQREVHERLNRAHGYRRLNP